MSSLVGMRALVSGAAFAFGAPQGSRVFSAASSLPEISTDSQLLASVRTRAHCILGGSKQIRKGGHKNKEEVMSR